MDSLIGTIRESLRQYTPGNWVCYRAAPMFDDHTLFSFGLNNAAMCEVSADRYISLINDEDKCARGALQNLKSIYAVKLDRVFYNL